MDAEQAVASPFLNDRIKHGLHARTGENGPVSTASRFRMFCRYGSALIGFFCPLGDTSK
jgi:hypothetical protein